MHEELLAPFHAEPGRAGIFMDFDGTLSQIVLIPSDARPVEGAREVLALLARSYAVVAIVSGRSAADLLEWLGPGIEIWGVHGAETVFDGKVVLSPRAEPHMELMGRVLSDARRKVEELGIDGVLVEDKTTVVNLHYRAAPDTDRAGVLLDGIAAELAREHGLHRASGRLTFELRAPESFSKEDVVLVRSREAQLEAVLFVGDDTVDLPAFEALDALAGEGVTTVKVAVASSEAPPELLERADLVVPGPAGTVRLLESLANEPG
jgi:trehalose 6-phosphate phosphatase